MVHAYLIVFLLNIRCNIQETAFNILNSLQFSWTHKIVNQWNNCGKEKAIKVKSIWVTDGGKLAIRFQKDRDLQGKIGETEENKGYRYVTTV